MKKKYIDAYMDMAERFSLLSSAVRCKVGSIVVKDDRIISLGYNGTPTDWDNCCEYEVFQEDDDQDGMQYPYTDRYGKNYRLVTKSEVLHAEMNALMKLAKYNESGNNAVIFITHAPCMDCAKGIYQAGIKEVYYKHQYRDTAGIKFLESCGIPVIQM